jgi:hypothetical protein
MFSRICDENDSSMIEENSRGPNIDKVRDFNGDPSLLQVLWTDAHICREIYAEFQEDIPKRYKATVDLTIFLVEIEQEKKPHSPNHYLTCLRSLVLL